MPRSGTLYLIPSALHESNAQILLPVYVDILKTLRLFIVENVRTTRRFLKTIVPDLDINACEFIEIDKHQPDQDFKEVLERIVMGADAGLLSEAGCPAIADPGSKIVALAHDHLIKVSPWIGPSSILLALMASGFNGQGFTFHGYLPSKSQAELIKRLRSIESEAIRSKYTQLFIETPYRNLSLLKTMLETLHASTHVGLAIDLTGLDEKIVVHPVAEWKKVQIPDFQKHPAIFLIHSNSLD